MEELQNTKASSSATLTQSREELASAVQLSVHCIEVASAGEVEALHNAKAVLAGAQYSL